MVFIEPVPDFFSIRPGLEEQERFFHTFRLWIHRNISKLIPCVFKRRITCKICDYIWEALLPLVEADRRKFHTVKVILPFLKCLFAGTKQFSSAGILLILRKFRPRLENLFSILLPKHTFSKDPELEDIRCDFCVDFLAVQLAVRQDTRSTIRFEIPHNSLSNGV